MGAAVGVAAANVPADILQLFKECEDIQNSLADRDLKFLQSQSKQMWKNHKKIISTISQKTKTQLRRMVNLQKGASSAATVTTQLQEMLGGAYGEFVRNLVFSRSDIDAEVMRNALGCIGCDEISLINILCTSSKIEIDELLEKYNAAGAVDLGPKINGKLENNSPFQKFMKKVVTEKRDLDSIVSDGDVSHQMQTIFEICNDSTPERDVVLFELLCKISRAQCVLINSQLLEKHNTTLDKLLKHKYKGNCGKALSVWTMDRNEAVAQVIYDVLHDSAEEFDRLASIVARFEKMHLRSIASKYEILFSENLVARIEQTTVGNYKLALVAWITASSFDGDNEEVISSIISEFGSLSLAMDDPNAQERIRELLRREKENLEIFSANEASGGAESPTHRLPEPLKMSLPPIANNKGRDSGGMGDEVMAHLVDVPDKKKKKKHSEKVRVSDAKVEDEVSQEGKSDVKVDEKAELPLVIETETPVLASEYQDEADIVPLSQMPRTPSMRGVAMDFDKKFNAACAFLREQFSLFDRDKSGYLETSEFWNAVRSLDLGYTEDEIAGMAQWTDWDCDGSISLEEVINELAESMINMIESKGCNFVDELDAIRKRVVNEQNELIRLESNGGLSVTLVQYLKDSFEAYDSDENGRLEYEEFWKVINVVLVETINGLKDIELEEMRAKWDANSDGYVTWKEALVQFIDVMQGMISDKRDHWIGLVDKPTGNLFWYNLRDESSCWMSEEDQIAYRAGEKINKQKKVSMKY